MRINMRPLCALTVAIVLTGIHQNAVSANKTDPCAAPPYGMTPSALAFWKESIIDAVKATARMQEICRMKMRQTSRKPLHELGLSDEIIDAASPLSLMYQSMGAGRFAAQLPDEPSRPKSTPPQQGKRTIRSEDIEISEQNLQRAIYNLKFNGDVSSNLEMLARLGVRFQDQQGRARDFGEVAADTAAALQRIVASGRMTSQEAEYAAREAGLYGSVATAAANNDPGLASAIKKAKAPR